MNEEKKREKLLSDIRELAKKILPEGSRVALYGSRARRTERPDSDWDLHILIPGSEKLSIDDWDRFAWPLADVGLEMDEIVTPRLYSFSGWKKRHFLPFFKNVERDKIIILQK